MVVRKDECRPQLCVCRSLGGIRRETAVVGGVYYQGIFRGLEDGHDGYETTGIEDDWR